LSAITKTSCKNVAPSKLVVAISLARPAILESKVQKLTLRVFKKVEVLAVTNYLLLLSKSKESEFTQYLRPVGLGPSLKT
jgi:hypothetical protein